jgi:hypothetical protein
MLNFENVYKGNALQVDWSPELGNHDYKGKIPRLRLIIQE